MDDPDGTPAASLARMRRLSALVGGLVFLTIGLSAFTLCAGQLLSTARLFARTSGATGVYVDSTDRRAVLNGGIFLYARFQFRSADGRVRYATARDGSTQESYAIGDKASIRYDPKAPDDAVICSFWTLWVGPMFCGVFTLAFGIPGAVILLRRGSIG